MKEKGFTLIELLAVIVVLAIIALIATPIILGVIENSRKKAFEDTGYGVVDAIRHYYIDKLSKDGVVGEQTFTFPNSGLSISGTEPAGGKAKLHADGTIEIAIHNNSYCVTKGKEEDAVTSTRYVEGECKLPPSSGSETLLENVGETTTRTGCTGEGVLTKVTHDNGDVDYRYQGKCPNNYVNFNNETWRIIGVFDGRMKIIRDEKLTDDKAWDCKGNPAGGDRTTCTGGYSNNWETSTLKTYLSGDYYDSIENSTTKYRDMIDTGVIWYLGGNNSSVITKEVMYGYERDASKAYGSNPATSTTTKIGLAYPSDYGYAAEEGEGKCPATNILGSNITTGYNITGCKNNNWMFQSSYHWWLIAPSSFSDFNLGWCVEGKGSVLGGFEVIYSHGVRPALYLKPSVKISGGDGKSTDTAYTLSM